MAHFIGRTIDNATRYIENKLEQLDRTIEAGVLHIARRLDVPIRRQIPDDPEEDRVMRGLLVSLFSVSLLAAGYIIYRQLIGYRDFIPLLKGCYILSPLAPLANSKVEVSCEAASKITEETDQTLTRLDQCIKAMGKKFDPEACAEEYQRVGEVAFKRLSSAELWKRIKQYRSGLSPSLRKDTSHL